MKRKKTYTSHGTMSLTPGLERVSRESCWDCAYFDATQRGDKAGIYANANSFQYYVCINVWAHLIDELADMRTSYAFLDCIRRRGLLDTILLAKELSNDVIHTIATGGSSDAVVTVSELFPSGIDIPIHDLLQILRFPKRFTPVNLPSLKVSSITKFVDINRRCGDLNHTTFPYFILEGMKWHLKRMLCGFSEAYANTVPHFSSGTTTSGKTLAQKIKGYGEVCKYFADPLYPIGDPAIVEYDQKSYSSSVRPVPKDSDSYRIIAPEHPYFAAQKQRIKDAYRACLQKNGYNSWYDPECQDANRNLAFVGSITGEYATIDLTSASDSICESLVYYVMPEEVLPVLYSFRTPYIEVCGKKYRKRMYATSGDPTCFDTEAMIFLSLELTVIDIVHALTGATYLEPLVFGDDIIVDVRLYETMRDFLGLLGCIPNDKKSFANGSFRESCGVDYFCGMDLTSTYWPRTPIMVNASGSITPNSLASVISLQHKVFRHYKAQLFLSNLIYDSHPNMTSSCVGAECSDLWADIPCCIPRVAPHDGPRWSVSEIPDWAKREAHMTVTTNNTNYSSSDPVNLDVEMYHYVDFLVHGPYYEDPLSELLGVSAPRSRATDFDIPELVVKPITR